MNIVHLMLPVQSISTIMVNDSIQEDENLYWNVEKLIVINKMETMAYLAT